MEYAGIQFSSEQEGILKTDLQVIDQLQSELNQLQSDYLNSVNQINNAQNNIDSCYSAFQGGQAANCAAPWGVTKDGWVSTRDTLLNVGIPEKANQIAEAKKNYNADLLSIQDQIKFQIQASQGNNESVTVAGQNDPNYLIEKAKQDAAIEIAATNAKALIDAQKREQNAKIVLFVLIGAVALGLGLYFIKKMI